MHTRLHFSAYLLLTYLTAMRKKWLKNTITNKEIEFIQIIGHIDGQGINQTRLTKPEEESKFVLFRQVNCQVVNW